MNPSARLFEIVTSTVDFIIDVKKSSVNTSNQIIKSIVPLEFVHRTGLIKWNWRMHSKTKYKENRILISV